MLVVQYPLSLHRIMNQAEPDQLMLIVLGLAAVLLLVAGVILFVVRYQKRAIAEQLKRQSTVVDHQNKMLMAALESQENERRRISKDLHDDVGMMLMTLRTQLNVSVGKPLSEEQAEELLNVVDDTHETVRKISWDLLPPTLERFGVVQALQEMCHRMTHQEKITVSFYEKGKAQSLDKNQETLVYRIAQECVINALRHARAKHIDVKLDWKDTVLCLTIADDGVGFDFPEENDRVKSRMGLGLVNMASRVRLLCGEVRYKRNNPTGTVVEITIPVNPHG